MTVISFLPMRGTNWYCKLLETHAQSRIYEICSVGRGIGLPTRHSSLQAMQLTLISVQLARRKQA